MKKILFLTWFIILFMAAYGQEWTLIDTGAGLIADAGNNKRLKIIKRNSTWDIRDLYEKGAHEGRYNGNQLFAAWIQGPETKEFMNIKGMPVWMYKYRITYPDGITFESEPIDFFNQGFSYFPVEFGEKREGVWKIEWFIYNRETRLVNQVATTVFQTTWGEPEINFNYKVKTGEQNPPAQVN